MSVYCFYGDIYVLNYKAIFTTTACIIRMPVVQHISIVKYNLSVSRLNFAGFHDEI